MNDFLCNNSTPLKTGLDLLFVWRQYSHYYYFCHLKWQCTTVCDIQQIPESSNVCCVLFIVTENACIIDRCFLIMQMVAMFQMKQSLFLEKWLYLLKTCLLKFLPPKNIHVFPSLVNFFLLYLPFSGFKLITFHLPYILHNTAWKWQDSDLLIHPTSYSFSL